MNDSASAEIVTVYRAFDGGIRHARCGHEIALQGRRGSVGPEMELDFYCFACAESVTLPFCVLSRIPVAGETADAAAA
jgi:hypothetical protein